jgi:hypothetical protein
LTKVTKLISWFSPIVGMGGLGKTTFNLCS